MRARSSRARRATRGPQRPRGWRPSRRVRCRDGRSRRTPARRSPSAPGCGPAAWSACPLRPRRGQRRPRLRGNAPVARNAAPGHAGDSAGFPRGQGQPRPIAPAARRAPGIHAPMMSDVRPTPVCADRYSARRPRRRRAPGPAARPSAPRRRATAARYSAAQLRTAPAAIRSAAARGSAAAVRWRRRRLVVRRWRPLVWRRPLIRRRPTLATAPRRHPPAPSRSLKSRRRAPWPTRRSS